MNSFAYATRTLRKSSGFSLTVVILLTLGIGGTVAIFSIVNAALVRPLPYANPEGLVLLFGNVQRTVVERRGASMPDYRDWKEQNHTFEGLASFWSRTFILRTPEERVPIDGEIVGASYFDLLRVKPARGRTFRAVEETDASLPATVVVSHEFWTKRLAADPAAVGRQLTLNATSHTIIGVMPPGFRGIREGAQLWVTPASLPVREQAFNDRGARGLTALGRLREGVSIEEAQADMDAVSRALERAYPQTNDKRGVEVIQWSEEIFGSVRPALLVLLAAVTLVLLVACANVANLLMLRTETRHAEIALRTAVGASRAEVLKVLLTETMLLSFTGAAMGLLFSGWAVELILAISPIQLPSFVNVTLDSNVVIFAVGLAWATALLLAIIPAVQFVPSDLQEALSGSSARITGVRTTQRFRNSLIVGEVALSFVLLLTAGLLVESFRQLLRVDTGFETSNLLTLRLAFEGEPASKAMAVKESIERLPGVRSVALSSVIPFSVGGAIFYAAEGEAPILDAQLAPRAYLHFVTPGFFKTMGIPLLHGRDFRTTEPNESVMVSQKLAQRFWPGEDPVGKRIRMGRDNSENPWLNIVGVVGNTKTRDIPDNPTQDPDIYFNFGTFGGNPGVLIRTAVEPSALIPTVLSEVKRIDSLVVISNVSTVEALMRPLTARARFLSFLSGVFSVLALVLALVGIHGSMSYTVMQRTREIGIRMALGASRGALLRLVLGRSLALICGGLAFGLIGSYFAGQGISKLLFGVSATSPSAFLAASLLMILGGLAAAYIPARRAARIDPLRALRQE
jgi:predicted permease